MFLRGVCAPSVSSASLHLPLHRSLPSRSAHDLRSSSYESSLQGRLPCRSSTSAFSHPAASDSSGGEKNRQGFDGGEAFRMLEGQCKNDAELREIVGDCIVDPESSQKRVESRVKRKERTLLQRKLGSPVLMAVSFRDFDPHDSCIWLELYDIPTEEDVELLGNVFRSWYIIGHLGSFNSLNIQLTRASPDKNINYNSDYADKALPCNFHNTSNLEFQNKWGRIWVDLGTSDPLPWDILINTLASVSSDHIGIKQLIFGGEGMGGWQENMTSANLKYKVYKL